MTGPVDHARIRAAYARVPRMIDCRGACWTSCGPIFMANAERDTILARGVAITPGEVARLHADTFWCEALGPLRTCTVYDDRPMICRLWGAVEGLPCPHGCQPERTLTDAESFTLLAEVFDAGGGPAELAEACRLAATNRDHPEFRRIIDSVLARGRAGDQRRSHHADFP